MFHQKAGIFGAMFLIFTTAPVAILNHASPEDDSSVVTRAPLATAATVGCSDCVTCVGGHKAPSGAQQNAVHSYCMALIGCGGHGICNVESISPALLELYLEDVIQGDVGAAKLLLEQHPDAVHLNVKRQTLQVKGCFGELVGNIPLTTKQIAAVSPSHGWRLAEEE